ncbi:hypothetical protein [Sulfurimonas sp. C5]|uniref:hypothetical protein n=1 Tax=Sulfurimonas sp. C5 TaxID=3036947 RepID=UPI002453A78B|nr:hypothetical protein [Sulfurimonas sp. C5]MDH4943671.1 hypothetical protein [Sulfurimonas sp. C5]
MKKLGKILFFNATEATGIIITAQKEKLQFNVMEWNDFDVMPTLGLEVFFELSDGTVKNIIVKQEGEELEEESSEANSEAEEQSTKSQEESQENTIIKSDENNSEQIEEIDNNQDSDTPVQQTVDVEVKAQEEPISQNDEDDYKTDVNENRDEPEQETTNKKVESQEKTISHNNENESDHEKETDENQETDEPEHFQDDPEIECIEDLEEEYGPREESVTLTLNLKIAVQNYFNIIEDHINSREKYKKVNGKLDYLIIKRFLWTMFNNLSEIDIHIITPQIRSLSEDLKIMGKVHEDFMRKTKYPSLAYEEVFLACQDEYMKIKRGAQDMMERLARLQNNEKHVGSILKVKKEELSDNINTEEFDLLQNELKSLNGAYVDTVHMMAELDERYKHDMELLKTFEDEYRGDFYEIFNEAAQKHKTSILEILNAQAFFLDSQLWDIAKNSKAIKSHFQQSSIDGELNTKTYLKYYLDLLDNTKANDDTKKLFELYDYLASLHKEHIMVLTSSAQDAMDHESALKKLGSSYEIKAFINEKSALKWALKHSVKVLVVEDQLTRMRVETFLKYYQKYILVNPKIILLGEKPLNCPYPISKLLSKGVSSRVITQNVKDLLIKKKAT